MARLTTFAALAVLALTTACAATTPPTPTTPEPATVATAAATGQQLVEDDPPRTMYTAARDVRLRQSPDLDAPLVDILPGGRAVLRFRHGMGWARVLDLSSRNLGWVDNSRLSETDPTTATPRRPGHGSISETF